MRIVSWPFLVLLSLLVACDPPPADGGEGEGEGEAPCFDFDERRCSANGAAIERCVGSTNSFQPETFCSTGEQCEVVGGVPDCVPAGGEGEGEDPCFDFSERRCSSDGSAAASPRSPSSSASTSASAAAPPTTAACCSAAAP